MTVISAYGLTCLAVTVRSRLRQHQCWAAPQPATATCTRPAVQVAEAPARRQRRQKRAHLIRAAADAPQEAAGSPSSGSSPSNRAQLLLGALCQLALLAVALAGLILLPAWLSGRLVAEPARAAASYALYILFFGSGTLSRMLRYGQLAPRKQDAQLRSSDSRLAFALFLIAVPAGHYLAWWGCAGLSAALTAAGSGGSSGALAFLAQPLQVVGYALMLAGWALNAAAAAALGKVRTGRSGQCQVEGLASHYQTLFKTVINVSQVLAAHTAGLQSTCCPRCPGHHRCLQFGPAPYLHIVHDAVLWPLLEVSTSCAVWIGAVWLGAAWLSSAYQ